MKIIFVCTGNTCRSPIAEYILKRKVKESAIKGVTISSAGLNVNNDDTMSVNSKLALKQMSIRVNSFKSKQLTVKMIEKADVLICMTEKHKKALEKYTSKAFTIAEMTGLNDITDPYGQGEEIYIKTAKELEKACQIIFDRLIKNKI